MPEFSIARRVLNTDDPGATPADVDRAIQIAHLTLAEREVPLEQIRAAAAFAETLDDPDVYEHPPATVESAISASMVRRLFEDRAVWPSPFSEWPEYERMYETYGAGKPGAIPVKHALLLGSLSALSSRAFETLAKDVYGAEFANVVDIRMGAEKARHGSPVRGSAFRLPYQTGSIQLVQSNRLLPMVRLPSGAILDTDDADAEAVRMLMEEVHRVLQPGGHLLMREVPSRMDHTEKPGYQGQYNQDRVGALHELLSQELARHAFRNAVIEPGRVPVGVDYLFDAKRQAGSVAYRPARESLAIYARR